MSPFILCQRHFTGKDLQICIVEVVEADIRDDLVAAIVLKAQFVIQSFTTCAINAVQLAPNQVLLLANPWGFRRLHPTF